MKFGAYPEKKFGKMICVEIFRYLRASTRNGISSMWIPSLFPHFNQFLEIITPFSRHSVSTFVGVKEYWRYFPLSLDKYFIYSCQ